MVTDLATIEPFRLPDQRRPGILPSLPEWAAHLSGVVRREFQMTTDGMSFEEVLVLSPNQMPTAKQRRMMMSYLDSLGSLLRDTPAVNADAETKVATTVSKLLTVLASERKSDLGEEARCEVYLDVLDDVPWWAVVWAARAWLKHQCGTDERGRPYDYKWPPDPGTLREIARRLTCEIRARMETIQRVLEAREYVDCTKQLAAGRAALDGLSKAMKAGDLDAVRSLTFDRAIRLGSSNKKADPFAQEAA